MTHLTRLECGLRTLHGRDPGRKGGLPNGTDIFSGATNCILCNGCHRMMTHLTRLECGLRNHHGRDPGRKGGLPNGTDIFSGAIKCVLCNE